MTSQSTTYQLSINTNATLIVLVALFVAGIAYALIVRRLRRRNRNHGYTAFLVVGGDLLIAIGFGFLAGAHAAGVLLACMAAAGIPMIVEYVDDHLGNHSSSEGKLEL
jgi:peptidoglycan/LPS O-acetylase OafA/YrhL